MFKPSSRDEDSPGQRLSIWVEELTIADQGWAFMGCNPANTVVACLDTDAIRAIAPPDTFGALNIEWEQALTENGEVNTLPGAEGHAGISGLCQGGSGKADSKRRRALRSKLADNSQISPVPVPHNLPEDYIRVAAYFIYENTGAKGEAAESHWVHGVRQLRRAAVKEHEREKQAT